MVVLLYMAAANTETLASTRQYTQLNARALRSVEVYNKHRPILTCKIPSIDLLNCSVSIAYVMQRKMKYGTTIVNRIFVSIRHNQRKCEIENSESDIKFTNEYVSL